jgi:hypothetical protein
LTFSNVCGPRYHSAGQTEDIRSQSIMQSGYGGTVGRTAGGLVGFRLWSSIAWRHVGLRSGIRIGSLSIVTVQNSEMIDDQRRRQHPYIFCSEALNRTLWRVYCASLKLVAKFWCARENLESCECEIAATSVTSKQTGTSTHSHFVMAFM